MTRRKRSSDGTPDSGNFYLFKITHTSVPCIVCLCVCVLAVTVEEQIVRQLTEKRLKELSSCISDTRREYQ